MTAVETNELAATYPLANYSVIHLKIAQQAGMQTFLGCERYVRFGCTFGAPYSQLDTRQGSIDYYFTLIVISLEILMCIPITLEAIFFVHVLVLCDVTRQRAHLLHPFIQLQLELRMHM